MTEPIILESKLKYKGALIDILHYEDKNGIPVDDIKNFIEELYDEIKNKKRMYILQSIFWSLIIKETLQNGED
jgi:hypothetical protein